MVASNCVDVRRRRRRYDDGVLTVVHRLLDEALTLSEQDRRMLAEALFDSVTSDELESVWRAEILRRIEQVQRGEVTAVSSTSLTVVSEDDHSQTYVLGDDTLVMGGTEGVDSIEKGDQVRVTGLREGGSVRAVHVVDVSRIADLHPGWGPAPEPTTTTGTTTTTNTTADV